LLEDATATAQLAYTRRWAERNFAGSKSKDAGRNPVRSVKARRIRIGYLSSEFHEHAIAYLFAGVLEAHDRNRFEIFAYSYGPEDQSAMRTRLHNASEHFIDVAREADDTVVKRIEEADLDILVDLKGYTLGARTNILAQRPCAIQVNWLGYPGTMGADFIDCLITDPFIVPQEHQHFYSEQIIYLSHCWQCNDRSRPQIEPLDRTEYRLPENAFVYCCFTQSVKITPDIFARWMSLLKLVPASVLWLAEDNRWATEHLIKRAQQHGIAPDRLVFSPRLPFAQHLARYRAADLALDTFPYTSHSTASDALWSGCPIVALCGETFAARVSGSILTHANLPELITYSLDEYEALASRLATDARFRNDIRLRVAQCRASPLFDAESFTRDIEGIYERLTSAPA
jgi:predicted O-linked N-acetylglucosamine transferase (SPINDLY family)